MCHPCTERVQLLDQIVLVRHGRPRIEWPWNCRDVDFERWIADYSAAELDPSSHPPHRLLELAAEAELFVSSELLRAYQSANELSQGVPVIQLAELNEVALPALRLPVVRLPASTWLVLARAAQLAGCVRRPESVSTARERSWAAVRRILAYESRGRRIAVVGHGVINQLIATNLKGMGWRVLSSDGFGYWRWQLFVLPSASGLTRAERSPLRARDDLPLQRFSSARGGP